VTSSWFLIPQHVLIVTFSAWMSLSAVNYSGWLGSGVGGM